ncbi:MAG TPA: outer membrane beta-barrel protein [Burkholderiales bacterium]
MSPIKLVAAALLALGGLVAASQTAAQGFYIGGSVGKSDFDDDNAIPDLITSGSVDGSDTGFKIFGGYQFNQHFGVELAWVDLGKAGYSGTFSGLPVTGGTVETSGLNLSAVGILPLGSGFALFGKAGFFAWESKAKDVTGGLPFSGKEDGTDLSLGIGASYDFTKNFGIRAEWERFKAVGDIDLLSVGIVYKF